MLGDAAALAEEHGERDVEEVVAGDAEPHVREPLGLHRPVEHAQVVRVGGALRGLGGERPAVQLGVDALHRQVRALHEPHLHRRAPGRDAGAGARLHALHRIERVGEVRLQHDADLEAAQLGAVEQPLKHRERELEVAVLLHVEVDELRRRRRGGARVERREPVDDLGDGGVEPPRLVRGDGRRHLDRDVVDVVAAQQGQRAFDAAASLALAEHRLAEEVDVEPHAVAAQPRDRGTEARLGGVDDEVPDHPPQHAAGDRHDDARQPGRERAAGAQRGRERSGEERGDAGGEAVEVRRGDLERLGPHNAVHEADGEGEPVGVAEHVGELLAGGVDGDALGLGEPLAHEGGGGGGELAQLGRAAGDGSIAHGSSVDPGMR